MNTDLIPFTHAELLFIGLYLSSLVVIGGLGYRARRENSLRDFYLAGKGIGFIVLLLTLYATQYSGNTLFGFSGTTYRIGYAWAMSIHFMTAIVVFYLLLAPKLYRLAKQHQFITPTDYLQYRFGSRWLSLTAAILMIVAIANFLLAQLMALGAALEGLTEYDPVTAYTWGVVVLALIIVIYETLGGFRAVAWTDVIQGTVLMIGFAILVVLVFREFGSLENATQKILKAEQQAAQTARDSALGETAVGETAVVQASTQPSKVLPPGPERSREWLSYILLVGLGGALYPQAIQRIYAARSATTLRRSLAVMAFLPLTTTVVALIVGVMGAAYIPDLIAEQDRADTVLTVICRHIQESSTFGRWLVVILFSGILAATMSTADSVLLSISSMVTKDVYGPWVRPDASEQHLTKLGKLCSWVLIGVLVGLAIALRGTTLVQLLDRKFDLLVQLAPAFFVGIHWSRLRAGPTLAGILVGVGVALTLVALGHSKLFGIHPGLFGLAANLLVAVVGSLGRGFTEEQSGRVPTGEPEKSEATASYR